MSWWFQHEGSAVRCTGSLGGAVEYPCASAEVGSVDRPCSKIRGQLQDRAVAHPPLDDDAFGAEHPIMAGGALDALQPGHDLAAADREQPSVACKPDRMSWVGRPGPVELGPLEGQRQ